MNERDALKGLARHFNYFQNRCAPNVFLGGGEMDLAVITRSGYLVEVEVKLTLADWQRDRSKEKWAARDRGMVSRFYYAVPTELVAKKPAWVADGIGLLELIDAGEGWINCFERIKAIKTQAPKLAERFHDALLESTYHRFWQRELTA